MDYLLMASLFGRVFVIAGTGLVLMVAVENIIRKILRKRRVS